MNGSVTADANLCESFSMENTGIIMTGLIDSRLIPNADRYRGDELVILSAEGKN